MNFVDRSTSATTCTTDAARECTICRGAFVNEIHCRDEGLEGGRAGCSFRVGGCFPRHLIGTGGSHQERVVQYQHGRCCPQVYHLPRCFRQRNLLRNKCALVIVKRLRFNFHWAEALFRKGSKGSGSWTIYNSMCWLLLPLCRMKKKNVKMKECVVR